MKKRSRAGGEALKGGVARREAKAPRCGKGRSTVHRPPEARDRGRAAYPRTERGTGAADSDVGSTPRSSKFSKVIFSQYLPRCWRKRSAFATRPSEHFPLGRRGFRSLRSYNTPPVFAELSRRSPAVRPDPGTLALSHGGGHKTVSHIDDPAMNQAYIERFIQKWLQPLSLGACGQSWLYQC